VAANGRRAGGVPADGLVEVEVELVAGSGAAVVGQQAGEQVQVAAAGQDAFEQDVVAVVEAVPDPDGPRGITIRVVSLPVAATVST